MIRARSFALCVLMLLAGCQEERSAPVEQPANKSAAAGPASPKIAPAPLAEIARVRIETEAGDILVELDGKRAPITTANFLAYAEQGRFDGTSFYRAARTTGAEGRGFIQGGIRRAYRRMLPPIAHEPTDKTSIRHEAGTISMARSAPGNAMGEFFITTSAMPSMDAKPGEPGFAAFGRVVEGMDVVRLILAASTVPNAGRGAMKGQMLEKPVVIERATRVE
jgi:peptidyl-prolyl cis-trans isomerase A (cyclophilin A)